MYQIDHINKIIYLKKAHPHALIKICVDTDSMAEWGWTEHHIDKVELLDWIEINERIYTDEDQAKDEISDMLYDADTEKLNDADFQQLVDNYYAERVVDAICVFTSAPT